MKLETILYYKDNGIETIKVSYSGGGDSGAIDEYIYYDKNKKTVGSVELINDLEEYCYKITNNIEDWWNNDGGDGIITINLLNGSYEIENNIRYYEYEKYEHSGEILTD